MPGVRSVTRTAGSDHSLRLRRLRRSLPSDDIPAHLGVQPVGYLRRAATTMPWTTLPYPNLCSRLTGELIRRAAGFGERECVRRYSLERDA